MEIYYLLRLSTFSVIAIITITVLIYCIIKFIFINYKRKLQITKIIPLVFVFVISALYITFYYLPIRINLKHIDSNSNVDIIFYTTKKYINGSLTETRNIISNKEYNDLIDLINESKLIRKIIYKKELRSNERYCEIVILPSTNLEKHKFLKGLYILYNDESNDSFILTSQRDNNIQAYSIENRDLILEIEQKINSITIQK